MSLSSSRFLRRLSERSQGASVRIGLAPDTVQIARGGSSGEGRVQAQVIQAPAGRPADWRPGIEALRDRLPIWAREAKCIRFVLSNHFAHFALLPWNERIWRRAERLAQGRGVLESIHGGAFGECELEIAEMGYRQAAIICGVERELLQTLRDIAAAHRLRLISVQPYFTAAYAAHRAYLDQSGCFAVTESSHLTFAVFRSGHCEAIGSRRILGTQSAADVLLQELLAADLEAQPSKVQFLGSIESRGWPAEMAPLSPLAVHVDLARDGCALALCGAGW